jgi:hypothetical protein
MNLSTIFSNPAWKFSTDKTYPHQHGLLDQDGIKTGVIIVLRGRGQDFALGVNGLTHVIKAEQEGRIKIAHVVLAQINGEKPEYIAAEKAAVVHERLCNYLPIEGRLGLGPYWWITADFMPATTMKLSSNALY